MKNVTLEAIAKVCNGNLIIPEGSNYSAEYEIAGVAYDNRRVEKDYLFIPFVGERVDGHTFIEDASKRGAYATLSMHPLENCPMPYIIVEQTKKALIQIATFYREQLTLPIIGIIGSVGKTSTKEMVSSVLATKFNVLKTEGNFNNDIGLPATICRITAAHEVAVVEMGISDFNEMHVLGDIAKPDIVVMTNIGQCHLENLIDRDGILKAKTEVFEHMPDNGVVILNGDDDKLQLADTLGMKKVFFGLNNQEVSAKNIQTAIESTSADMNAFGEDFSVKIPLPGKHNVMNALAATAIGVQLGLSIEEIAQGINSAGTISGRNNVISLNEVTVIDDCYNANPVSMKASIEVLSKASGRTIAVLGDMGELGADERELHYGIGETLDENHISCVYTVGALSAEIKRCLEDMDSKTVCSHYDTKEKLLADLLPAIKKGDSILVKASHFMQFGEIVDAIANQINS